jgi:dihydrofolate reductase
VPVCAQAQRSSQLNAEAHNVVKIITSDKAKTQTYCQIADLIDQLEEITEQEKADELSQKITVLEGTLPEYAALVRDLHDTDIDPKSGAGKSLFARDCVVGLGGLELPTKRLSAASSEH